MISEKISISYNNITKSFPLPEDYKEFCYLIMKAFNISPDDLCNLSTCYKDDDGDNIDVSCDCDYIQACNILTQAEGPLLFTIEPKLNESQSVLLSKQNEYEAIYREMEAKGKNTFENINNNPEEKIASEKKPEEIEDVNKNPKESDEIKKPENLDDYNIYFENDLVNNNAEDIKSGENNLNNQEDKKDEKNDNKEDKKLKAKLLKEQKEKEKMEKKEKAMRDKEQKEKEKKEKKEKAQRDKEQKEKEKRHKNIMDRIRKDAKEKLQKSDVYKSMQFPNVEQTENANLNEQNLNNEENKDEKAPQNKKKATKNKGKKEKKKDDNENTNDLDTINKQCFEQFQKQMKKEFDQFVKKSLIKQNEMMKTYINKVSQFESMKFSKMQEDNNNNQLTISSISSIHNGIKCDQCGMNPIQGIKYKCSICQNYNLCEMCEEKNYESKQHPHEFIKCRDPSSFYHKDNNEDINKYIISTNNNNNDSNENGNIKTFNNINDLHHSHDEIDINSNLEINEKDDIQENHEDYDGEIARDDINNCNGDSKNSESPRKKFSFLCTNKDLIININKGEQSTYDLTLVLKNDYGTSWNKETTKLICNQNKSKITCEPVTLPDLMAERTCSVVCKFEKLNELDIGSYLCFLDFSVDGIVYGNPIIVKFNIIGKIENIDENKQKILQFRNEFSLPPQNYSDEVLLKALELNNFDFYKTLDYIVDNVN